jgi:hypothetical protein
VVGQNSREAAAWRLGPAGNAARTACGKVLPASNGGVPGWHRARRSVAGLTQSVARRGGAVGRRSAVAIDGGGVGTVVADDGALALHHGERERE